MGGTETSALYPIHFKYKHPLLLIEILISTSAFSVIAGISETRPQSIKLVL